jgi:SCY1-like protein 1
LIIETNQIHVGGDSPIPHVMTFFASPDRALRLELLQYLPQIIRPMDSKTLVEIWGHIETGFSDTVPTIREGTLKAILHLMAKVACQY